MFGYPASGMQMYPMMNPEMLKKMAHSAKRQGSSDKFKSKKKRDKKYDRKDS